MGSNERNPPKAEAREGRVSGSERVIGPGVRWCSGLMGILFVGYVATANIDYLGAAAGATGAGVALGSALGGGAWSVFAGGPRISVNIGFKASAQI